MDCRSAVVVVVAVCLFVARQIPRCAYVCRRLCRSGERVVPWRQCTSISQQVMLPPSANTRITQQPSEHTGVSVSAGVCGKEEKRWLLKSLFARPCVYNAKYLQMGTFSMDPTAVSCICCNRSGGISVPEESLPLVRAHVCHLSVAVVLLAGLPTVDTLTLRVRVMFPFCCCVYSQSDAACLHTVATASKCDTAVGCSLHNT